MVVLDEKKSWEDELDASARVNLSGDALIRYHERKRELKQGGLSDDFIEAALRGWIWDESERQS